MSGSRVAARKLEEEAPVFAALGDETRLHIVARLCEEGPLSIVRLTQGARMSRQGITKHLHLLAQVGLVRGERSGREHVWKLQTKRLARVRRYLDQISTEWDETLERLRVYVERR